MPHAARRHRDTAKPPAEWDQRGEEVFRAVYRDAAEGVQKMLYDAYPDLGPSVRRAFCSILFYVPSACPRARGLALALELELARTVRALTALFTLRSLAPSRLPPLNGIPDATHR